jgi:ABC-type transport system involved in multi-copper enzyme maturation permease subunit
MVTEQSIGLPDARDLRPLVVVLTIGILFIGLMSLMVAAGTGQAPGNFTNSLVRGVGVPFSCVLFFMIALNASRRLSRERERRTLDSLLTIPEDWNAILFAKWLASLLSVRGLVWCLPVLWGLGLVTGGVHPFALPLMAAAWVVYATFMASMGLWFSTVNRTSLRASLFTVLAALVVLVGPGFLSKMLTGGASSNRLPDDPIAWSALLVDYGLSPSVTLWVLTFRAGDLVNGNDVLPVAKVLVAVAGLYGYMAAGAIFWLSASSRLRAEKGSAPRRRPLIESSPDGRMPALSVRAPYEEH